MKLAVRICMGLAVIAFVLGVLRLWGVPVGFWGLQPGGYIQGAQALALLGIGFYCLGRLERRQE